MNVDWKLTEALTSTDLKKHPIWEYITDDAKAPETAVRPVMDLPAHHLGGRLVGAPVKLHNGEQHWAICSNISLRSLIATTHFLCLWIEKNGQWFALARYHDVDFQKRSPRKLAEFLGLPIDDVFPIEYDISKFAVGDEAVLKGSIAEVLEEQLSEDELIQLALTTED